MKWWNKNQEIPLSDEVFQSIINNLLFNCPTCIRKAENVKASGTSKKTKIRYKPVSARESSFKKHGITGNALLTVLAQIRRPLARMNTYKVLKSSESVAENVERIIQSTSLSDSMFEMMVYHTRSDMPDAEAIYYYIRNAFAHGSFEVCDWNNDRFYFLESNKDGTIKTQMRLREKTLLGYAKLAQMSLGEIRLLQRNTRK